MSQQDSAASKNNNSNNNNKNPGITSYDPDAIESYQFSASSKCGDLLVGVNGKELVGFAVEKEAPSTTFFFETLEQVARCVAICKVPIAPELQKQNHQKKEWIVAVGGDQKFVDIYTVTLEGHVSCCQAFGRIGPFPKRIQSLSFLNEEKKILLVADRFGDIYHVNAHSDAKPELMSKRSGSQTPRRQQEQQSVSSSGNQQQQHQQGFNRSEDHPHLRFALQHLGLVSAMRTIPSSCPSPSSSTTKSAAAAVDYSPLLVSCDVDNHVRVSCGRRPGLLLQNLWPEMLTERDQVPQPASASSSSSSVQQPAFFTSTAGKTVSCISYFAGNESSTSSCIVAGRCDGTLSMWNLVRGDVDHLNLNGTATCSSSDNKDTPIVGLACVKLPVAGGGDEKKQIVVFAKADSSSLYGWDVTSSSNSNIKNTKEAVRRSAPESSTAQSSFKIPQVKNSNIKKRMNDNADQEEAETNTNAIIALFGCSAISPTAVIAVFRDATVEMFDIIINENKISCTPIPFPASGSHTRVPLPFSAESRQQLSRAKTDAVYSIVSNQIASELWQNKYKGRGGAKEDKDNNGNDGAVSQD